MLLRLAVVAVPMGLLLSRSMAWMSSGKTHAELISRLRGNMTPTWQIYALFLRGARTANYVFVFIFYYYISKITG